MLPRKYPLLSLILILMLGGVVACGRQADDPLPTVIPTASVDTAVPTSESSEAPPPTAVPTVSIGIDPADIDWSPMLLAVEPDSRAELPLDAPISLRFDQPMDQASVEDALQLITADGTPINGRFQWPRADTVVFTPASRLQQAQQYKLTLASSASGQNGQALAAPIDLDLQSLGYLEISRVLPDDGIDDIQTDAAITVVFNRPVVALVSSGQQARLPQPLSFDPAVAGSGEWVTTSIYRFTPDQPLDGATTYRVTVDSELESISGGALENGYQWSFSTTNPEVAMVVPAPDSSQINPTAPISVTFNTSMDTAVTEAATSLRTAEGQAIAFTTVWRDNNRTMGLRPSERLPLGTTLQLQIEASATDATGAANLNAAYQSNFTTVPFPAVLSTTPGRDQTADTWQYGINIQFASPMDADTIEDQILIDPPPNRIQYSFYESSGYYYANLSFALERSTNYQVTIPATVADPYGNSLGQAYTWEFDTLGATPLASFNLPGQISQLSTSFPSNVGIMQRNISRLDITLHELGLPMSLLGAPYEVHDYQPAADPIRTWDISVELPENELSTQTLPLADGQALPTGVYLLQATAPEMEEFSRFWQVQKTLLIMADHNIVVKEMFGEIHAWVTTLNDGQPVAGSNLRLFTRRGAEVGTAVTDNNGYARFDHNNSSQDYLEGVTVVSGQPGQAGFGLTNTNWGNFRPWQMGISSSSSREVPLYVYLYTDRPIYRPGDTVYFKGIARETQYGRYDIPAGGQQIDLILDNAFYMDQRSRFEEEISVTVNGDGTFEVSYTLPDDMVLGTYNLSSHEANVQANIQFTVADYRSPEFLVQIVPDEPEVRRGEATAVTLEAELFAGGSAAGLEVVWQLYQEPYRPDNVPFHYAFGDSGNFNYTGGDGFPFGPGGFGGPLGTYMSEGRGTTDENGRLTIPLPANLLADVEAGSRTVNVQANVSDLANFPVSSVGQVVFHAADTYIGLRSDYIGRANNPITVDLLTVDWDGRPQANQEVTTTFYRRDWTPIRESMYGLYFTRWDAEDTQVGQTQATTNAQGQASTQFTPTEGGSYIAVATVTDAAGRSQTSSTAFWVTDSDFANWRVDPLENSMDLTVDQEIYQVGDTANILIQLPFEQPVNAWLTIERGTLMEQRVIQLAGGSEVVSIPITADMAPNVHVSIAAVKPASPGSREPYADIRVGLAELVVDPEQLALSVNLSPQTELMMPGETAVYDILVTDYNGQPVQAELSLALVDLAVLTLLDDNATPILEAFYQPQPMRSQIGAGLFVSGEGLAPEEPIEGGGLGGGGGGFDMVMALDQIDDEDDVRRDFPDTAYWQAILTTASDGTATVEIPLPDTTTIWRLSSKAVTADTLVGESYVDIQATLPLLLRPVTPRFFTVGDQIQLGSIVQNNTDDAIEADVTLQANGLSLADGQTEQTITVAANSQQLVRWSATVDDVAWVDLTFRVAGGGFTDATKPSFGIGPNNELPVYRYTGQDVVGTAGVLDEAGRQVEAILLPPGVDMRQGQVAVELSPSLAAAMLDGLQALNNEWYQSTCPNAVVDRLLPNLATRQAISNLDLDEPALAQALDGLIETALSQLAAQQLEGGAWGWCGSQTNDAWLTAYAVLAITQAETAGYDVDDIRLASATSYISNQLRAVDDLNDSGQVNRQAFFLYVLAEAGRDVEEELDDLVTNRRTLLDPYARALLALGYERVGAGNSNRQATLLSDLNNSALVSAAGTHWQDESQDFHNLSSEVRGTAMVVSALAQVDPTNPLLAPAVRWLMVNRSTNHWSTSHETAWSIWGLTYWLDVSGELEADYTYGLLVNGRSLVDGQFTQANLTEAEQRTIPLSQLVATDVNFFDFRRGAGNGRFYYTLYLNSHIDVAQISPMDRGFTVQRTYYAANCDPATEECQPLTSITAGERVRVELTLILPHARRYVILEDPLPAGATAIDPNLNISDPTLGSGIEQLNEPHRYGYWGWSYFNHIQYRDDRVVFQSVYLPAGTYQYSYYLQTNIPGSFQVRPAVAYESFFPDIFGRSEGLLFIIEE